MDSGNGSNQPQRYCPTPIMAPPSVATPPPIMGGGNVMSSIHQPHHPPPSISPHPAAYYGHGHHTTGQSHYPTPSPTPPPMHHQQYYGHGSYYPHGSHQTQQQSQQQQQQHHGMANAHVPMNTPQSAPPSVPQGQHPHMMTHGGYHHPQTPTHHQQWVTTPHPHQQQSHLYYHQPTHHPPQQQQQQQVQPQQHSYPPPPHSPYAYVQSHPHPAPTPPPHSPHPQQHIQPPQHQQPPPVPASPGPSQMHQGQQQVQSHALMNLSRFVNQQSPSPCPSPRASPSLACQLPVVSQIRTQSPSPFGGHIDHHSGLNGHVPPDVNSSPVMSPPPPPIHSGQPAMSPPASIPAPITQHHLPVPPQQIPYSMNGSGGVVERPTSKSSMSIDKDRNKLVDFRDEIKSDNATKEREMLSIFPNLSSAISTNDSEHVSNKGLRHETSEQNGRVSSSTSSGSDDIALNANSNSGLNVRSTISEDVIGSSTLVHSDVIENVNAPSDIPPPSVGVSSRESCSPQPRPIGSPTNTTGNGHQMIPVRLQNMQKGARTKASMRKLMQEHQISTPNGQISEIGPESVISGAKELDSVNAVPEPKTKKDMAGKAAKSPRKRKSQATAAAAATAPAPSSDVSRAEVNMDLTGSSSTPSSEPVIRPGYTKSGKKIGRPRKDSLQQDNSKASQPPNTKARRASKSPAKKTKASASVSIPTPATTSVEDHPSESAAEVLVPPSPAAAPLVHFTDMLTPSAAEISASKSKSQKTPKSSRKRTSKVLDESSEPPGTLANSTIIADISGSPAVGDADPVPSSESAVTSSGGKRRKKSKASAKEDAIIAAPFEATADVSTDNVGSSAITVQEAESVALRLVHSSQSPPKGKGKRRKSSGSRKEAKTSQKAKRKQAASPRKKQPAKEPEPTLEREELPRLRSRSPKQRESPPLRISSPRAAKERSTTPATNPNQAVNPRSRSSKDKDVVTPITTPISSPVLRSPKKSPEKDKTKSQSPLGKARQKLFESVDSQSEILSPPPMKRTRQMSKESTESQEVPKGRRKAGGASESRLSVDSDQSPTVGKRASRRKSGSASDNTLSSPSFTQTNSSALPSETSLSLEIPPESLDVHAGTLSSPPPSSQQVSKRSTSPSAGGKRRKSKKASKAKSRAQKQVVAVLSPSDINFADSTAEVIGVISPEDFQLPEVPEEDTAPAIPVPTVRTKKPRKVSGKKAKGVGFAAVKPDLPEAILPPEVSPVKIKISKREKKQKASKVRKDTTVATTTTHAVLNIPIPTPPLTGPAKKVKKQRASKSKTPKHSKKSRKKQTQEEKLPEGPPTEAAVNEEINVDENESKSLFSPPQPQDLSPPSRRRRPSVISPSSSLAGPESVLQPRPSGVSPTFGTNSKAQRRDSRSCSREYEVSVVLTDIAQSLTAGDLAGGSSRLSVLSPSPIRSSPSPVISDSVHSTPSPTLKLEPFAEKSTIEPPSETPTNKRKRQPRRKSTIDSQGKSTQKKIKLQNKMELQERKANLEAEVAQVLLELKTGTSSKSPSPAKSIPSSDLIEGPIPRMKISKQRKRKGSTKGTRRSVDNFESVKQEAPVTVENQETPTTVNSESSSPVKARKRKSVKERRSSKGFSKSKNKSAALAADSVTRTDICIATGSQASPLVPQVQGSAVKVAKTAIIPTADSLGINDAVSTPISTGRKKAAAKGKVRKRLGRPPKLPVSKGSPDITAVTSSDTSFSSAVKIPKTKRKKKMLKSESDTNVVTNANAVEAQLVLKSNESELTKPTEVAIVKKKRARKSKASAGVATASPGTSSELVIASTSAGPSKEVLPSTSATKLFPYQSTAKPLKTPTVISKSAVTFENKSGKDSDNQKRKDNEGPTLKVIGGLTRFYRGGDEEEVDPDPKLPKEKAPLQTDGAVPWICSFCHLGPHAQKLGDLFGPYSANLPSIYGMPNTKRETWMHGDCALWAGRLLLIGTHLRRLEETLVDADKETCTVCSKTGATIGCLRRGCKEAVHFPCAVRKFWKMDEQNFHSYCPRHIT